MLGLGCNGYGRLIWKGICGLPDDPKAIRSDPLALFPDQLLLPFHHEELIKTVPGLGELGLFNLQNRVELPLAIHPFLIGASKAAKTHPGDHHQPQLHRQSDQAANQFPTLFIDGESLCPR